MPRNYTAQAVTLAVLLAALGIGVARRTGWRPADLKSVRIATAPTASAGQDPQDAIYTMVSAARAGDVKAYLAEFTGPTEATLQQSLAETSELSFRKYLMDSNSSITGVAVSDAQKITDLEASVRVEYVYRDRNEAQTMYLEKGRKGWKISRVRGEERVKTLIPYGTPVK